LQQAERLRLRGELDRARTICEPLVNRYPEYYGALHTLGMIYADKGQYPQALGCLVRASMLDPHSWKTLVALSAVYLELGASEMAARSLEQAKQIKPDDPSIYLTLAEVYRSEREYELARDAFQQAVDLDQTLHAAAIGLANCCLDLGDPERATEMLNRLIARGVRTLPVLALLNQLPGAAKPLDILSALEKVRPDAAENKQEFENTVAFVRGAALHRLGKHEDAWHEVVRANAELWPHVKNQAQELSDNQQTNYALIKDRRIKVRAAKAGEPQTVSLFILGPSRSGKTTMEALVALLPGVKRGYENPAVQNAVRRTFQGANLLTLKIFEALPAKLDAQCCELYLEELMRRAGPAKVFTNTHPGRIHDVARIAAAIPNVRFLFMKRNVEDNMFRVFMQKYGVGNADSYNLAAIRDSIVWYHQMIDLLAEKLPDISRVIHYEDMVADPVAALRVPADLCGLPMDHGPLPKIGDDRGCAEPYREMMAAALNA
jgi:tetratricopeptide (TPR) repeat protein